MKILLKFLILIFITSCENTETNKNSELLENDSIVKDDRLKSNSTKKYLNYIDIVNEIEISHTDDKYGEWGGDTDLILIYSDGKHYFANYSKYLGSAEPPLPPKENEKPKKWYEYGELEIKIDSIRLTKSDKELIEMTIFELIENKLRNPTAFTHSGIYNSIISRDSTLIINDYPSIEWKKFQELKKVLIEK